MNPLEIQYYKDHRIEIYYDDDPQNPRIDYDNFGTMVCFHKIYVLGDEDHGFGSPGELIEYLNKAKCFYRNLYLYDHSGITMKTSPFSCPWDSGQVGIIFVDREKVRQEFNVRRIGKRIKLKAFEILEGEVKTYDDYLTGQFYGYIILDKKGEILDSCWGFDDIDFAIAEAKEQVDCYEPTQPEKYRAITKIIR
jgi:hypothetical protein